MAVVTLKHLCSLGSSFASGVGLHPYVENTNTWAGRSAENYPHLLLEQLLPHGDDGGFQLTDLTAQGSSLRHVLSSSQEIKGKATFPPQLRVAPETCDVITITAGGNDLNYVGDLSWLAKAQEELVLAAAANGGATAEGDEKWKQLQRKPANPEAGMRISFDELTARWTAVFDGISDKMSSETVRVFVVEYLSLLGDETRPLAPESPFNEAQIRHYRAVADEMARATRRAVEQWSERNPPGSREHGGNLNITVVPMSELSATHVIGSRNPWVNGLLPKDQRSKGRPSFHPNEAGHHAVAGQLYDLIVGPKTVSSSSQPGGLPSQVASPGGVMKSGNHTQGDPEQRQGAGDGVIDDSAPEAETKPPTTSSGSGARSIRTMTKTMTALTTLVLMGLPVLTGV